MKEFADIEKATVKEWVDPVALEENMTKVRNHLLTTLNTMPDPFIISGIDVFGFRRNTPETREILKESVEKNYYFLVDLLYLTYCQEAKRRITDA